MSNIPEFLFDQVNGPRLIILNQDGITTSSLVIDSDNILRTAEGTPISVATSSVTLVALTASYVSTDATASYASTALTASYIDYDFVANKPTLVSSSAQVVSLVSNQQISPSGITSSLLGTSSYSINALSASWAPGGQQSESASYALTASVAETSSYAITASYVLGQSATASYALTASYIATASYAFDYPNRVRSLTITDPAANDQVTLMYTEQASTMSKIAVIVRGSITPAANITFRYNPDRSGVTTDVNTAGYAVSSSTSAQILTTLNNPNIPANNWVWMIVNSVSGSISEITATVSF